MSDDCRAQMRKAMQEMFDGDLHAKRVESLSNGVFGVMASGSLAVSLIGKGLALAGGRASKHAVKQVDRLLSNPGVDPWELAGRMVPEIVGARTDVVVSMDWTDFDADGHVTLALRLCSAGNGRAEPLLWVSMHKEELAGRRNDIEDAALRRLAETLPAGVHATILADRGFSDHRLYAFLASLGFDYVIRMKANVFVAAADGETRRAGDWVGAGGRARTLRLPTVTAEEAVVPTVVCVKAKGMKDSWCLASSLADATARTIIDLYARRWTIEPSFRDEKDLRFGMGLSSVRVADPERRDRLLLLSALAMRLLTLLGLAGESIGMDRQLKVNTSKARQHSLFRQGRMWFDFLPGMPDDRLRPLMEAFEQLLRSTDYLAPLLMASK